MIRTLHAGAVSTTRTGRPLGIDRRTLLLSAAALPLVDLRPAAAASPVNVFGVQTHMAHGWDPAILDTARALGLRPARVRDEVYWDQIERQSGVFDFAGYDAAFAKYEEVGTRLIYTCNWSNALYDAEQAANPGQSCIPNTPAERDAFVRYVLTVLDRYTTRYPGLIEAVEVWNEVNGTWNGGYASDQVVPVYVALLRAVYEAIRARPAFAAIKILGGACVGTPLNFIRWLADAGALDCLDGLVVHPYGSAESIIAQAGRLAQVLAPYGKAVPVWATEFGALPAAADVAKQLTACRAAGFERASWYLLRNYGSFACGLIDEAGRITNAGRTWRYLSRLLGTATYLGRLPSQPRTHLHAFQTQSAGTLTVAWTEYGKSSLVVTGAHQRVGLFGGALPTAQRYGLGATPLLLLGTPAIAEDLRGEVVLADINRDFSLTQGAQGWSYLARAGGMPYALSTTGDQWGDAWTDPAASYSSLSVDVAHPSLKDGIGVETIRRWTVPAGVRRVRVAGQVYRGGGGDGTDVSVLRNGVLMFRRLGLLDQTCLLDQVVDVGEGQVIDFVTGPGAARDMNFDATRWQATILATTAAPTVADLS